MQIFLGDLDPAVRDIVDKRVYNTAPPPYSEVEHSNGMEEVPPIGASASGIEECDNV